MTINKKLIIVVFTLICFAILLYFLLKSNHQNDKKSKQSNDQSSDERNNRRKNEKSKPNEKQKSNPNEKPVNECASCWINDNEWMSNCLSTSLTPESLLSCSKDINRVLKYPIIYDQFPRKYDPSDPYNRNPITPSILDFSPICDEALDVSNDQTNMCASCYGNWYRNTSQCQTGQPIQPNNPTPNNCDDVVMLDCNAIDTGYGNNEHITNCYDNALSLNKNYFMTGDNDNFNCNNYCTGGDIQLSDGSYLPACNSTCSNACKKY